MELNQRQRCTNGPEIDHTVAVMDDILVAGRDIPHHDSVLGKVIHGFKN